MAGDEQGDELVAKRLVAERVAVLVAWRESSIERMSSCASGSPARRAAISSFRTSSASARAAISLPQGLRGPGARAGEDQGDDAGAAADHVEQSAQRRGDAAAALGVLDAEHGAGDHLERDRLHAREDGEGAIARPGRDLALGGLDDDPLVAAHPLAVERGKEEAAVAQVLGPVEQQGRGRAEDRGEDLVALPGVEQVRIAGEDLLDGLGIAGHDDVAVGRRAEGEPIAAAALAGVEEAGRGEHEADAHREAVEVGPGGRPSASSASARPGGRGGQVLGHGRVWRGR